ncbi:hypothetical protein BEP19_16415 [Ammoniphilus oxalaticus]|uniref:Uncharacterized protein n=1 Tax=Ammoniphilus oxalaticus TaxID=66863 RepID=A0A419SQR6_9BACL|nr:YkuS family protein [Ammoniphilus oxalaticus]RKD26781.1 hypothetical protein BEP19_16415 [Ammoniphilus oxalaticus]
MAKKRIGVENTLSDIAQTLKNQGHDVVNLDENNAADCDYCVVSGQNKHLFEVSQRANMAGVINADGMTADDVLNSIDHSF